MRRYYEGGKHNVLYPTSATAGDKLEERYVGVTPAREAQFFVTDGWCDLTRCAPLR